MERHGEEVHLDTDEARAGSTPHVTRYVLAVSLALVLIAFTGIWLAQAHL
ncbi:MAG: hypothetical protein J7496_15820 [Novosphingobium sp.]|nr:hypothetical protein [Novosphingobium sp.]MBO9603969.1 hypothetical protein [Novosphingobium sp.]